MKQVSGKTYTMSGRVKMIEGNRGGGGKGMGESSGWEVQRFAEVGKAWEKILSSRRGEEIQREEEEKYFGRGIRNHPRMTSPHKWLLCDQMISGTLFFRSGLFDNIIFFLSFLRLSFLASD